ncbi:MAG: hypothetical protein HY855_16830 [Burkholderiales bacterium]|nr:hypothetical protein [Burkholderiales bacterium]
MPPLRRLAPLLHAALAVLPLALLWPLLRHALESRMSLHMLLEFPALALAGASAQRLAGRHAGLRRIGRHLRVLDWHGWSGATFASAVATVWMLPSALDAALLSEAVNAAKMASWWLAGWLVAGSARRWGPELLVFGAGNLGWMMATAGLLYLDAPSALCVNYGADDQRITGTGLVMLACLLGALALRRALRLAEPRPPGPQAARAPAAEACNITGPAHPSRG